jgi:flagellar hook protein FlgE
MWDMVLTSISGDTKTIDISGHSDRRIRSIEFDALDGSYTGLNSGISDTVGFTVNFGNDSYDSQTISIDMGIPGQFNGLTQFSGSSTVQAREQDGYEAASLSTITVNNEGMLIGIFSNGVKKNIASLQIALFQNTDGLENIGNGYFIASVESGKAMITQALRNGAGGVHGGALEKSNTDVATKFVNIIQAQNGFETNAKTIKIAKNVLRELTNFIR